MTGPPADDAFSRELRTELVAATEQAQLAGDNLDAIYTALDRLGAMVKALDDVRAAAGEETKELIARALRLGVDPRDLYGRPFSSTIVREVATKRAGLNFPHRGRRPRTTPNPGAGA